MEARILATVGKVAGLGGLALGVLFLIFRDILAQHFMPLIGLNQPQAFAMIMAMMVLTFGIAGVGVIGWLLSSRVLPTQQVNNQQLFFISGLIIAVLFFAAYVGRPEPLPIPPLQPPPEQPPRKAFSDTLSLSERGTAATHGVLVKAGDIAIDDGGFYVDVSASMDSGPVSDRLHKGQSFRLYSVDCTYVDISISDVFVRPLKPGMTLDEIAKFGPVGELMVTREAKIIVSGKCAE